MRQPFVYLLLFLLSATACSKENKEKNSGPPKAFFDLRGYIQGEAERLSEAQPKVIKRISIDGQQEEHTFDSLDYKKELAIFSRSDINKTSWFDKYQVDSTFQDGQLKQVTYTSKDKGLKTNLMEVQYDQGAVSAIHIRNATENQVADVHQEMFYRPKKGYSLASGQSTVLSKEKDVRVEVEFLEF